MKIYIDSACDIHYSSYYLYGLKQLGYKLKFTSKYFKDFKFNNQFVAFVIIDKEENKKIIIDYGDSSDIHEVAYNWCDKYFKINIKYGDLEINKKLNSIPPSFGINIFNIIETVYYSITNYFKSYSRILSTKSFLSNYRAQLKRLELKKYFQNESNEKKYIFFTSSIWKNETITNQYRANFIKACKKIDSIDFEGGFAPRRDKNNMGFDEYLMDKRIPLSEYLEKNKKSFVVFNTPAVLHCHGWKLAEFLAMGKVIISTPISRELPIQLKHGSEIIITDGTEEENIKIIKQLQNDDMLYDYLRINSKKYFNDHVSPKVVCERIIRL